MSERPYFTLWQTLKMDFARLFKRFDPDVARTAHLGGKDRGETAGRWRGH